MKTTTHEPLSSSTARVRPSLALGAAALGASAAHAGIIYNDFADLTVGPDPNPALNSPSLVDGYLAFDLALQTIAVGANPVGGDDFRFLAADLFTGKKGPAANGASYGTIPISPTNLRVTAPVSAGSTVDASTTPNVGGRFPAISRISMWG